MERPTCLAAIHASVTHQIFTGQQLLWAWHHRHVLGHTVSKTDENARPPGGRSRQKLCSSISGETDLEPNRGTLTDCRQAGLSRSKVRKDRARN